MAEEKLSVIVPVYNVEPYLWQCLESITCQSYQNMEILLIDDGSTDRSGVMCEEYAQKDSRIKVFHQKNSGQAVARNIGLDNASGEYITFVDSDDKIGTDMYSKMITVLNAENAEIAACAFYKCYANKILATGESGQLFGWNTEEIFLNRIEGQLLVWNKVYRKDVIGGTRFIPGQIYEEVHFNHYIFLNTTKMVYIDRPFYYYRVSRDGNTNSRFKPGRLCIFNEFDSLQQDLAKHGYSNAENAMTLYALEFYRRLYKEAWSLKAGRAVRRRIRDNFEKNYHKLGKTGKTTGKGLVVFHICPNLLSWRDLVKKR